MGKSLGNAIALSDDRDTIAAKIRGARTDSERTITYDPERASGDREPADHRRAVFRAQPRKASRPRSAQAVRRS